MGNLFSYVSETAEREWTGCVARVVDVVGLEAVVGGSRGEEKVRGAEKDDWSDKVICDRFRRRLGLLDAPVCAGHLGILEDIIRLQ